MTNFEVKNGVVIIPEGTTTIDWDSYADYSNLKSVTIPASVTNVSAGSFLNSPSIESIVVEEGNPIYDSRGRCNAIIETATNTLIAGCKSTIIPDSVTVIESNAFEGCTTLESISIPESVTKLDARTFYGCTSLKAIYVAKEKIDTIKSMLPIELQEVVKEK